MIAPTHIQPPPREIEVTPLQSRRLRWPEARPEEEVDVDVVRQVHTEAVPPLVRAATGTQAEDLPFEPREDAVPLLRREGIRLGDLPCRPFEPHEGIRRDLPIVDRLLEHRAGTPAEDVAHVLHRESGRLPAPTQSATSGQRCLLQVACV